jgi:hypothetical protein
MHGETLETPFASAFRGSYLIFIVVVAGALCLVVPPVIVVATLGAAVCLWAIFQHPLFVLGAVLAFMPVDYMAIELGKFFGLSHMSMVSACTKEIPLLLLTFVLWRRNGFKAAAPDWFLLTYCGIATLYTVFGGSWAALAIDLNFVHAFNGRARTQVGSTRGVDRCHSSRAWFDRGIHSRRRSESLALRVDRFHD